MVPTDNIPPAPADQVPARAPRKKSGSTITRLLKAKGQGGLLGVLATLVLLAVKLGPLALSVLAKAKVLLLVLLKAKFLLTGLSMLVSMWAYAGHYGWPLGVAFVLMIFIHECGHAFAGRLRGKPVGLMMFIPFCGAFVQVSGGKDAEEDAFIGIMGPIVGSAAGLLAAGCYLLTGNPFWLALAQWTLFINLFNLIPVAPLDGGWIVPLFSPKVLAFGALLLLPLTFLNPLIGILGLLSLPRIIAGWRAKPGTDPYFSVAAAVRWRYGLMYLGLIVTLGLGVYGLHHYQATYHPQPRPMVL